MSIVSSDMMQAHHTLLGIIHYTRETYVLYVETILLYLRSFVSFAFSGAGWYEKTDHAYMLQKCAADIAQSA